MTTPAPDGPAELEDQTMRIALVAHYFPPHIGGVEVVVERQAQALAALGHDVHVLTTALPGPAGDEVVDGYRVHRVPAANPLERLGVPFPFPHPRAWRRAWREVGPVDVIHAHDVLYLTTWAAGLRSVLRRTPLVLHQHVAVVSHPNPLVELVQRVVYGGIGRLLARRARIRFVLNDRVGELVDELAGSAGSVSFLRNGVDRATFHPARDAQERRDIRARFGLPQDEVLAIFVGRPVPKKGFPVLMAATGPEYVVVTVGGPGSGADDDGRAIHLGGRSTEEVAALLRASDVFVLPSIAEGFPLSVQEAMASGLPVVMTDDPGYVRYELDPEQVRLVRPEVEPVRAALAELAADASLRERMGAWSAAYATEHFCWERHAEALAEAYATVTTKATTTVATKTGT